MRQAKFPLRVSLRFLRLWVLHAWGEPRPMPALSSIQASHTHHRAELSASGPDIVGRLIGSKFTEAWASR